MSSFTNTPSFTTTLFGPAPTEKLSSTSSTAQGSLLFYQDRSCSSPLSNTATPLLLGSCLNKPFNGIQSVSISSLPNCPDYGTPLLIISDLPDCKNSTMGSSQDGGVPGKCLAFSSGTDIGSVGFQCWGNGVSSVGSAATSSNGNLQGLGTSAAVPTVTVNSEGNTNSSSSSDDDDCYCCCVVM